MHLSPQTISYLNQRAAAYDGTLDDILSITPPNLDTDSELLQFWQGKHLSHIQPRCDAPHLANDWSNILPEDPDTNLERGGQPMDALDVTAVTVDSWLDASTIELTA